MTLILKQLFNLIKLLNSDTGAGQIAAGVACGMIMGMIPFLSLQTFILFIFVFIFKVQLGAFFLSAFFFAIPAYFFDPLFDSVGQFVLELSALKGLYTALYNFPVLPYSRFNNSIVMGSFVLSIIFAPFVFLIAKFLVNKYRYYIVEHLKGTALFKALKATALFKWYYKYDNLYR